MGQVRAGAGKAGSRAGKGSREAGGARDRRQAAAHASVTNRDMFQSAGDALLLLDTSLRVIAVNEAFSRVFRTAPSSIEGQFLFEACEGAYDTRALRAPLRDLGERDRGFKGVLIDKIFPRVGRRALVVGARRLGQRGTSEPAILLSMQDVTQDRDREEALRREQERFRAVVEHSSDIMLILDTEWTPSYVSPAVERILGRKPQELIGSSVLALVHSADAPVAASFIARWAEEPGAGAPVEVRLRHGDGTWRVVEAVGDNMLHDPAVQGIVVSCRDVTERKKAEDEVRGLNERLEQRVTERIAEPREARTRLEEDIAQRDTVEEALRGGERLPKTVLQILPFGILVADERGAVTMANTAAREIWGDTEGGDLCRYSKRRGWFAETGRKVGSRQWPLARAAGDGETVIAETINIRCFDGTSKTISSSALPITDSVGRVVGAVAITEDITERWSAQEVTRRLNAELAERITKRTEQLRETTQELESEIGRRRRAGEALRESEETFRAIFEGARIGIARIALDGTFRQCNPALQRMLGYSAKELRLMRLDLVMLPDDLRQSDGFLEELVTGKRNHCEVEKRLTCKDGAVIWGRLVISVVRDAAGRPASAIVNVEDITQRRHLDRLKSDFVAMVSHELRTPLTVIFGYTRMLLERTDMLSQPDVVANSLRAIHERAHDMTSLVEELLEVVRIEAEEFRPVRRPVDVGGVVERCVAAAPLTEKHSCVTRIGPGLPAVLGDERQLSRALSNLLSNAVKFSPDGGRITVEARATGRNVCIRVSDEGVGVPEAEREGIFEMFTQADMSTTRAYGGVGIGLYLARWAVEAQGGRIRVDSMKGKGSTFTIELPVEARQKGMAA